MPLNLKSDVWISIKKRITGYAIGMTIYQCIWLSILWNFHMSLSQCIINNLWDGSHILKSRLDSILMLFTSDSSKIKRQLPSSVTQLQDSCQLTGPKLYLCLIERRYDRRPLIFYLPHQLRVKRKPLSWEYIPQDNCLFTVPELGLSCRSRVLLITVNRVVLSKR